MKLQIDIDKNTQEEINKIMCHNNYNSVGDMIRILIKNRGFIEDNKKDNPKVITTDGTTLQQK